jgi:hypothetical protein
MLHRHDEAGIDGQTRERNPAAAMRTCLCLSITVCGLALRKFGLGLGLPFHLVKYGGSILWGAMVFFLLAIAASRLSRPRIVLIAAAIAIRVELFRLVHTPWLDDFRLTSAGALLLGRVFSVWNMLAYGVGIAFAMWLDRLAANGAHKSTQLSPGEINYLDIFKAITELRVRPSESEISMRRKCSPSGASASGMSMPVGWVNRATRGVISISGVLR